METSPLPLVLVLLVVPVVIKLALLAVWRASARRCTGSNLCLRRQAAKSAALNGFASTAENPIDKYSRISAAEQFPGSGNGEQIQQY